MDVKSMRSPVSLESCCLCVIRRNNWMRDNKHKLACLPGRILYELCRYLSPYGLYLLEEQVSSLRLNVDYLYLTQWAFPPSYALKARSRRRETIASLHSRVTNEQFFYDSVLNEVIEQLMYTCTIDQSIDRAWHYFTQYPAKRKPTEEENIPLVEKITFMNMIASHAKSLTINLFVASRILQHQDLFLPILHAITFINLNLRIKSSLGEHVNKIVDIVKIARQYKLSSVCVKVDKMSVLNIIGHFNEIIKALFCAIENCNSVGGNADEEFSGKMKRRCEGEDFDEIYHMPHENNVKDEILTTEDNDLFNYIFEQSNNSVMRKGRHVKEIIHTQIVEFELSAYESPNYSYFLDYISQWTTLQKLCIHGFSWKHDLNIQGAFMQLAEYNSLRELTLSEFWLSTTELHCGYCSENALIELARPVCSVHEGKKSLQILTLHNCRFRDNFLSSILHHQPSKHCSNSSECIINGVGDLEMTLFSSSTKLSSCLRHNNTLEKLIIYKAVYDASDEYLLDVVAGMTLNTFSLISKFKPPVSSPPSCLPKLLQNVNLNRLELSQLCHSVESMHGELFSPHRS